MTGIDTNVLIYACDKSDSRKHARALEAIADATDGVLLWQVACEFIAASRKLGPQGFTPAQAWARLSEFLALFPLTLPTRESLDRARDLHVNGRMAFWDAMIIGGCLENKIVRFLSEDLPGGTIEGIEVLNPFD